MKALLATDQPEKDRYERVKSAQQRDNERFVENQQHEQAVLIEQQDQDLSQLEDTLGRLGAIALEIRNEADIHNEYVQFAPSVGP